MYLSGSKWSVKKRRRRSNPWRIFFLLMLIAGGVYLERVVVPTVPPLFIQTPIPTRSPASFALEAETLFEAGKLVQAEQSYQDAIRSAPQEPAFFIELARIQVFLGRYDEAVTNASNALLLDPNSALANAVLGWALDFQGGESILDALQRVETAIAQEPESALINAYYAEVLIDSEITNFEPARAAAEKAVRLDPNLVEAHRALGYVWELTGNYDQAFESYQAALRINPNLAILHIALGNMYMNPESPNLSQAREAYLKAVGLAPEDVTPLRLVAQSYAREGEFGKASQYSANAVELQPENARLHGDLGRMFYKNQNFEQAIEHLGLAIHGGETEAGVLVESIKLDPGDPFSVELYYTYGLALAKGNRCSLATDIAEALITGVPEDEIAVFNAQEILILCGLIEPTSTPASETASP